jgi:hypothetical protein
MDQPGNSRRERNCELCKHYRLRPRVHIRGTPLVTPEVLKAETELQAEYDSLAVKEQYDLRAVPNLRFPEEPIAYPWCWMFTPYDAALLKRIDQKLAQAVRGDPHLAASARLEVQQEARKGCDDNRLLLRQARDGDPDAAIKLRDAQLVEVGYVTNTLRPYYALCRNINNKQRDCPLFESKEEPAINRKNIVVVELPD